MESDVSEGVRREGGLLIQTGLTPDVFATLRDKLGFREGYRQMIVDAWRKYVVTAETVPEQGTPEYDALSQFLYQPDVFRQLFVLQNNSLTGTTFMRPAQEVFNELGGVAGFNEDGTIKNKDLTFLFAKIKEAQFDAGKNKRFADEIGLTKQDLEVLAESPGKHKEYAAEISYGIKSRPVDLLADKNSIEVFSFLSSPLSTEYVRDSLRTIANYLREQINSGAVPMSERAKQFALAGFLPLLDQQGTVNDQARVRLRNVLWAMQSYGICSIDTIRDSKGGLGVLAPRMNKKSVSIEGSDKKREMAAELFVRYIEAFLSGADGGDAGKGTNALDRQTLEWVLDNKREMDELGAADRRVIERFLKNAGNPIYLSITRLTKGGRRPTIGKMMGAPGEANAVVEDEDSGEDKGLRTWDGITAEQLVNDGALLDKQIAVLEKQTEKAHIESRKRSFIALQKMVSPRGEGKGSDLSVATERAQELTKLPVDLRISAEARAAHLKQLAAAHRSALDLYNRFSTEYESVRTEIRKQRGVRWNKSKKNWDSPTRPETHFSKALDVFERSIKGLLDSEPLSKIKEAIANLEAEKHLSQTTLPAAQRSIRTANDAIDTHGSGKQSETERIQVLVKELERKVLERDSKGADEILKDLDGKVAKLLPLSAARQGREAMRKSKEQLFGTRQPRNPFVDQIRAGGSIDLPGYSSDPKQLTLAQRYRARFYRELRGEIFKGIAAIQNKKGRVLTAQNGDTVLAVQKYIQDHVLKPIIDEAEETFFNDSAAERDARQEALRSRIRPEIEDLIQQLRERSEE